MKKYMLSLSALALGTMLITSVTSYAEGTPAKAETTGKVNFIVDTDGGPEIIDPTDPENPNVIDPDGDGGTSGDGDKAFNITWVSHFDFGNIAISGKEMNAYAAATKLTYLNKPDGTEVPAKENLPHFIQVTDNRGKNTGWNVTASASKFKSVDNEELEGAQLLLTNPYIFSTAGSEGLEPTSHGTKLDLLANPAQENRILTAETGKGQGTWSMAWSPNKKGNDFEFVYNESADKGVQLIVPVKAQPKADTAYVSTINWVLSDTPNN